MSLGWQIRQGSCLPKPEILQVFKSKQGDLRLSPGSDELDSLGWYEVRQLKNSCLVYEGIAPNPNGEYDGPWPWAVEIRTAVDYPLVIKKLGNGHVYLCAEWGESCARLVKVGA